MPELENARKMQSETSNPSSGASGGPTLGSYLGTIALVGLGVALIEEELLAGMALGVAAVVFPNLAPRIGTTLRPLLKSVVRAGYELAGKTREIVTEMGEQLQDVVAEVKSEQDQELNSAAAAHSHMAERSHAKKSGKSTHPRHETE